MLPLKSRLLHAEDDFLDALGQGGDAICLFERRWESLVEDIDAMAEDNGLDAEMAMLAHVVSSRLATLVETSVDLSASIDTLTGPLVDQLDTLMSELSLDDASPPNLFSDVPSSSSPRPNPRLSSTPSRKRRRSDSRVSSLKRQRVTTSSQMGSDQSVTTFVQDFREQSLPIPSSPRLQRKRRLSEADSHPSPHRHKRPHVGPRLHAVSDSFPNVRSSGPTSAGSCDVVSSINSSPTSDLSLPLDILLFEELSDPTLSRVSAPLLTFIGDSNHGNDAPSTPTGDLSLFLDTLIQPSYPDLAPSFIPSFDVDTRLAVYSPWDANSRSTSPSSMPSSPPPSTPPPGIGLDLVPSLCQADLDEHSSNGSRALAKSSVGTGADPLPYRDSCQTPLPPFMIETPSLHSGNDWTAFDTFDPLSWLSFLPPPFQLSPCFDSPPVFENVLVNPLKTEVTSTR